MTIAFLMLKLKQIVFGNCFVYNLFTDLQLTCFKVLIISAELLQTVDNVLVFYYIIYGTYYFFENNFRELVKNYDKFSLLHQIMLQI